MKDLLEYSKCALFIFCIISATRLYSTDHILTFFLKPDYTTSNQVIRPILVTYGGYLDSTDNNGQVVFPRTDASTSFTLIISPLIRPVFMLGNTIHHWELISTLPHKAFTMQRIQQASLFYWHVKEYSMKDAIIPLEGIVILADPQDFSVAVGKTLTNNQPQFILPTIHLHRSAHNQSAINLVSIKGFFGGLSKMSQQQKDAYLSTLEVPR